MTKRSDDSKGRSGPLGLSGGTWRLLIIPVLLCMILPIGVNAFMFRNDTAHTGVFNDGGTSPNNILLWNYSFGPFAYLNATEYTYISDSSTYASPAVVNGVVYEGSLSNNMTALDATTGAFIWNFQTDGDIHSSPAVVNNVVYFTSYDHYLYALHTADGSAHFPRVDIGAAGHSSPAVTGGYVYVGSDNGRMFSVNADTGAVRWSTPTNSTPYSTDTLHPFGLMHASPAVVGNVVYLSLIHTDAADE